MNKRKWTVYGTIMAVLLVMSFAVPAMAETPEQLRARADRMELAEERAAYTKQLVNDVLADAEHRASFLGDGKSPITVNVHGFAQTRFSYQSGGSVEATHGFNIPRARLIVSGDIYDFEYKVSGEWSDGGTFDLKDAWGSTDIAGLNFKFGQFKSPFMKSELVSAADTLGVDRSIVTYTFGQGRSQGVQLGKEFGDLRFRAAYTDGFNSANGAGVQNGYALTGRVDWDVTDWWSVGGAISWNDLDVTDYWTYTFDTGVEFGGFGLDASYVGRNQDAGDDWAAQVQASYYVSDKLQPYVQYEYGELPAEEALSVVTFGANYYFNDHVKWTTDFGYSLNGIASGWDTGLTGWNASADSGEYQIRTQITVQF